MSTTNDEEEVILFGVEDTIEFNDSARDGLRTVLDDYLRPHLAAMTCPKARKSVLGDKLCAGPGCPDCMLRRIQIAMVTAHVALENVNAALRYISRDRDGESAVTEDVTDRGRTRTCESCGQPFTGVRSDARYCTPACRQRAYRERNS